ncbi:MAG: hypothetical protein LBN93_02720 [Candidatus Symbiothrix sp.]|jgi:hypothetical protein|nr:hypothetical protein [Candidatus Symbiothrix sp.]
MEQKIIEEYLEKGTSVANHRFKSWEHCYDYFGKEDINEDLAGLHLGFFLASFGMYKGKAFLLQRDYKFLIPVVQLILKHKHLRGIIVTPTNKTDFIENLFLLVEGLKSYFRQQYPDMKAVKKNEKDATDTLITKIILGTLGITPAYDRYFKDGVKRKGQDIPQSFSKSSFAELIQYTLDQKENITSIQKEIKQKYGVEYPIMKIVDMYFWQTGYNAPKNKKS